MTWNAFHHRGEILRAVVETADERRDGMLPMHVPGVTETFNDELDLLAALQLKWHARLSGNIERELMTQPMDLESAVMRAWCTTTDDLPGIRQIIDRYTDAPSGPEMAVALTKAHEKEWTRLAAAAGLSNDQSRAAAEAGRRLEANARLTTASPTTSHTTGSAAGPTRRVKRTPVAVATNAGSETAPVSFVDRIKAVLAA